MRLKDDGKYTEAIPLLLPLAQRGHGFEVVQFQLGECYLQTARTAPSAAEAQTARENAASWILKAANSDLPNAQERAARLYLEGTGVGADPVEAAKWLLLVQRNPLRRIFGPVVIDAELEQKLRQQLSKAQWDAARTRADQWQPVDQPSVFPPPPAKGRAPG